MTNCSYFRNILVHVNMITTRASILSILINHNVTTYGLVFHFFVFIWYKQCFKKTYILPSIQHNLNDSGRCRMYKQATSKERAFLGLFHMRFSIQNLTIHTSLSLQNPQCMIAIIIYHSFYSSWPNNILYTCMYIEREREKIKCTPQFCYGQSGAVTVQWQ